MADENRLDPMALTLEQATELLGISRGMLEADVDAGAPTNADGTVNERSDARRLAPARRAPSTPGWRS